MSSQQPADLTVELGARSAAEAAPLAGTVCTVDGASIYYELHGLLDRYGFLQSLPSTRQLVT